MSAHLMEENSQNLEGPEDIESTTFLHSVFELVFLDEHLLAAAWNRAPLV
jgi:hypothetical protein